jgi:carbon-monoxide dehydrogenase medium subunit
MYNFSYQRPTSLAAAAAALAQNPDARLLAGGQSLIAAMKLRLARPELLVDLSALSELHGIRQDGDRIVIGAMTRHAEVAASALVRQAIPALAELAGDIGDRQVRNAGTLGGAIANADPAAEYPAAVLGLNATIETDRRSIAADNFFLGLYTTALEPGEIIRAVAFPRPRRAAYAKFKQPASRFALVGVFVAETGEGPRVAITGAGPVAFRAGAFEHALAANFSAAALASLQIDVAGLNSDQHAQADYRAHLIGVLAQRAVAAAH